MEDSIERAAKEFEQMKARETTFHVHPVQPAALRVLDSLVHEFESAGVDMVPVSHLRTVIDRIKAEERAQHGNR